MEEKENSEAIQERKDKLKKFFFGWIEDKYDKYFLVVLILAIAIRLYYFFLTMDQTLWHDEAEYVAMAKNYLGDAVYILNPQRTFIFSGIISLFFLFNLSEHIIRLFLVVLPSTTLVFIIYLLGKEMFNKKIGLIASLLISVSWTLLFWTARMQPDFVSMCFQTLSILFMWKYWKSSKTKLIIYSAIFASLGFQFKVSGMLVPGIFFVFLIFKDKFSFLIKKDYWIFLGGFLLLLIPQFIHSYIIFKNPFALFGTSYVTVVADSQPFAWYNLNFYYLFTENVLFYLFLIGVVFSLSFLLYIDVILRDKNKSLNPDFFSILVLILISAYYIFWIKGTDDRWVFLWLPFIFFIIGKALLLIYNNLKKYHKLLALIVILSLLGYGVFSQMQHADSIIKIKKDSYLQVKQAAYWMKDNSNPKDLIVSASYPQTVYYSERRVQYFRPTFENETSFNNFVNLEEPKFVVVSVFESHLPWELNWVEENNYRLVPVQAYFSDEIKTNALLIIYEVNYSISLPTN